jgi:hypothetical protein
VEVNQQELNHFPSKKALQILSLGGVKTPATLILLLPGPKGPGRKSKTS